MRYLQPVSHPLPPLSPSSLCPPAPVCILPLHHPVALFSSLLVTVCRPSPGLSFSSTPPRSFANFDFETKRRFLSLIDISPRARISSRPSTDRSPNQASKPARLTQPSTDYSSQRPCHPIINHRPANPSPTRQTHISISCNARLDCPLSSCLCVCVCVQARQGAAVIVVNKCHEGSRPDHLEWLGVEDCHSFRAQPFIVLRAPSCPNRTRLSVRSSLRRGRELAASSARH